MTERDEAILEAIIPILENMQRELDECPTLDKQISESLDMTIALATKALSTTPVS